MFYLKLHPNLYDCMTLIIISNTLFIKTISYKLNLVNFYNYFNYLLYYIIPDKDVIEEFQKYKIGYCVIQT